MNMMKLTNAQRAAVLSSALPYIQAYSGKIVVIKYGGNAMLNEQIKNTVMSDVALLTRIGVKVVLVHGGGPELSSLLKRMGKQNEFVDGLRVTDAETADAAQMVLAGKINKSLVALIGQNGDRAMGICGMDGNMMRAEAIDERLGFVGKVTAVDPRPIIDLLEKGYIPVVSSIAFGDGGQAYNVNADTAAACIAGALNAESLINMTDIAGVLRDSSDPSTLISVITAADAPKLMADGVITGGMIPKVQCCLNALALGVKKVFVLDGTVPHAILIETLTNEGLGTMFR